MNRQIFLDTLQRTLYGKIDDPILAEHIRYYENYILQEMASGRSEQEVLDELGDPRLIARTILEAADAKPFYREYTITEDGEAEPEKNMRVQRFEGWKATVITLGVILVILLIIVFVFRVIVAVLPILIVLGLIGWVAKKIWN